MHYEHYVALGDSYTSDLFPSLDLGLMDVAVALEREQRAGELAPVGAASLLHRNDDERYPEFAGRDLVSRCPGITFRNLSEDGATIGDVFGEQLPELAESEAPTLVTLTLGATDLLSAFARGAGDTIVRHAAHDIGEAYDFLVDAIRRARPRATIVVTTVCDPSDGTGVMPGIGTTARPIALDALASLNARIAAAAQGAPHVVLADAHAHFQGHGASVEEKHRWYWRRSPLEPNAIGASELRRVWLEALG
ncbi:MAG TPA: GDSL-type esterase/lipase family protein, partial [Gemmatimonadaceae bacterium]|nr:GDSL-type esterase/lipase family protein [Gemmatimonadaceae bacterium]